MDYISKLKKEPRIILAVLCILFFFFPWIGVTIKFMGISESVSANGFSLMKESFSMILLLLITLFLIALPLINVPVLHKFSKLIYLGASLLAIILSFTATSETFGNYVYKHIGFWLALLAYLGILVLTLLRDFNINTKSFKDKGVQGVFQDITGQITNTTTPGGNTKSSKHMICTSCNNSLPSGTKFCPKCGTSVPEAVKCTSCGAELPTGTAFCANCGTKAEDIKTAL